MRTVPAASPDEMLRIAGAAAPQQPSAIASIEGSDKSAMLSVRMTEATLEALASYALDQGTTQRRVVAQTLAGPGPPLAGPGPVDPAPPPPRGDTRASAPTPRSLFNH